jgi:hypothetical protein
MPETWGAAMDVPELKLNAIAGLRGGTADSMWTPGATTSGCAHAETTRDTNEQDFSAYRNPN